MNRYRRGDDRDRCLTRHFSTILTICWRKSLAPPEAGWRTRCMSAFSSFSCEAATLPSAIVSSHGNRSRKAFNTGKPAERSDFVGVRLLNMPRRESNECHGNAFQRTNCSGDNPSFSNVLQTIVAVGSEKPSRHSLGLLVRRGVIPKTMRSGAMPVFRPSKSRSDVIGIPLK